MEAYGWALTAAAGLAAVHVLAARFADALDRIPRNRWLSAAAGISIAYVFVHLLPEIAEIEETIGEQAGALTFLERHAYLLALTGLVTFYGVELLARRHDLDDTEGSPDIIGWTHLGFYGAYNAIVGYVLPERAAESLRSLLIFAIAMAVHFVVNDQSLRERHGRLYAGAGRAVVAAGVLAGALVGATVELTETAVGLPLAFIGGAVILTVLKEELPEERRSRFVPLVLGAVAYTALLLAL